LNSNCEIRKHFIRGCAREIQPDFSFKYGVFKKSISNTVALNAAPDHIRA
jgi:hypothetical protein